MKLHLELYLDIDIRTWSNLTNQCGCSNKDRIIILPEEIIRREYKWDEEYIGDSTEDKERLELYIKAHNQRYS